MSDLKKTLSSKLQRIDRNTVIDLMVSDVLNRNGVSDRTLKNLSEEQKEKIRSVFANIQDQVNELLD